MVGDFEPQELEGLVLRYLGTVAPRAPDLVRSYCLPVSCLLSRLSCWLPDACCVLCFWYALCAHRAAVTSSDWSCKPCMCVLFDLRCVSSCIPAPGVDQNEAQLHVPTKTFPTKNPAPLHPSTSGHPHRAPPRGLVRPTPRAAPLPLAPARQRRARRGVRGGTRGAAVGAVRLL